MKRSNRTNFAAALGTLLLVGTFAAGHQAALGRRGHPPAPANPLAADPRLRSRLTVRVSRMQVADLLHRMDEQVGVGLSAEGADVADQKIDLFTNGRDASASEILTALVNLLNAQAPPSSYHWDRRGRAPNFRYALVRDPASRRWEAGRAASAAAGLSHLLRQRFAALGREPFGPGSAARRELPSMRLFLPTLTDAQMAQLVSDRFLVLTKAQCTPTQGAMLHHLVSELIADQERRSPQALRALLGGEKPTDAESDAHVEVVLQGDAPRYLVRVGVTAARAGQSSDMCPVEDAAALADGAPGQAHSVSAAVAGEPKRVFALPAGSAGLMGDVLASIAARGRINLIADDYTQHWTSLGSDHTARSLASWLQAIQGRYSFEPARDGGFIQLRDRAWWLDERREIPSRLLTRWAHLLRGTNADRLQMLVELARLVPFSPHPHVVADRLQLLADSPELAWTVQQKGPSTVDSVFGVVANTQLELLLYGALSPAQQREVLGPGLTIRWDETPLAWRKLYARQLFLPRHREPAPGLTVSMRYSGDHLVIDRGFPDSPPSNSLDVFLPAEPSDDLSQLVGRPAPELTVEDPSGRILSARPRGPMLIYVTPAWPRPVVARQEEWPDLRSLTEMAGTRLEVFGTEATAPELRDWWKERRLSWPPLALLPTSAQRLGARHVPLAVVVDRQGRVTWVKEGYAPGDEALWRQQLGRASG